MDEENKNQEEKEEETNEQPQEMPRSYVAAQFTGHGRSGFMLTIHNVDSWQLTALAAELTDRAEEGRKMNRRRQMQEMAQQNAEMLNARKLKRKPQTDD